MLEIIRCLSASYNARLAMLHVGRNARAELLSDRVKYTAKLPNNALAEYRYLGDTQKLKEQV